MKFFQVFYIIPKQNYAHNRTKKMTFKSTEPLSILGLATAVIGMCALIKGLAIFVGCQTAHAQWYAEPGGQMSSAISTQPEEVHSIFLSYQRRCSDRREFVMILITSLIGELTTDEDNDTPVIMSWDGSPYNVTLAVSSAVHARPRCDPDL